MPRVLIIDDEPRLRELLSEALRSWDCLPLEAATGERALRLAREEAVDILLLDLNLPGASGLEILQALRADRVDAPAIILTGFGDLPHAQRAIELGVVAFLTKPCRLGELEQALDRARKRLAPPLPVLDPPPLPLPHASPVTLEDLERQHILSLLDQHQGNRTLTAKALGISRRTLQYRIAEYERSGVRVSPPADD
ncbi:MAG: response regulator transcription factor [Tepidisphaeraceae bacterium]